MKTTLNILKSITFLALAWLSGSVSRAQDNSVEAPWGPNLKGISLKHSVEVGEWPLSRSHSEYFLFFDDSGEFARLWTTNYWGDQLLERNKWIYLESSGASAEPGYYMTQNHTPGDGDWDVFTYYWKSLDLTFGVFLRDIINPQGQFLQGHEEGYFQAAGGNAPQSLTNLVITLFASGDNLCKLSFHPLDDHVLSNESFKMVTGTYSIENIIGQKILTGGNFTVRYPNRSSMLVQLEDNNGNEITAAFMWLSSTEFVYYGTDNTFESGHLYRRNDIPVAKLITYPFPGGLMLTWRIGVLYESDSPKGPFTKVTDKSGILGSSNDSKDGTIFEFTVKLETAAKKFYILRRE